MCLHSPFASTSPYETECAAISISGFSNVAYGNCSANLQLPFAQSCTLACDQYSDYISGPLTYTCASTGGNFTSTPSPVCKKRCDYPTQAQLTALNVVNGNCSVGGVNNFTAGASCTVACAAGVYRQNDVSA